MFSLCACSGIFSLDLLSLCLIPENKWSSYNCLYGLHGQNELQTQRCIHLHIPTQTYKTSSGNLDDLFLWSHAAEANGYRHLNLSSSEGGGNTHIKKSFILKHFLTLLQSYKSSSCVFYHFDTCVSTQCRWNEGVCTGTTLPMHRIAYACHIFLEKQVDLRCIAASTNKKTSKEIQVSSGCRAWQLTHLRTNTHLHRKHLTPTIQLLYHHFTPLTPRLTSFHTTSNNIFHPSPLFIHSTFTTAAPQQELICLNRACDRVRDISLFIPV